MTCVDAPHARDKRGSNSAPLFVAGVLVVAGCRQPESLDEPPFVPQYTTEHLRIRTDSDVMLCRGQFDLWEAQVDSVEETLGVSRDNVRIDLFRDAAALAQRCDLPLEFGNVSGCWREPVISALTHGVAHEIVHAWTMEINPDPLPLLREGLAVRLSGPVLRWNGGAYTAADLQQEDLSVFDYYKAAHFAAWLIEVYGGERFMELYARSSRGASEGELAAAVRSSLGDELSEVLGAYNNSPNRYYPGMGSQACGFGPRIQWQDDGLTWSATGSCLEGPLLGYENSVWQRLSIEVPQGDYVLDTGGRYAAMARCLVQTTMEHDVHTSDFPVSDDWNNRVLRQICGSYSCMIDQISA